MNSSEEAKRLGAALETMKKKSPSSGVLLGGRGLLTATTIKTLQTYCDKNEQEHECNERGDMSHPLPHNVNCQARYNKK